MATKEELETGFSRLGEDIDGMFSDAREDYRKERQELKDKWNRLNTRRGEIADKGDDAWEGFKDEMEEGWNDVKVSYEDLKHKLSDNHEGHSH